MIFEKGRSYRYYAFGNNPIKCTLSDGVIIKAEVIDTKNKAFKIDNTVVPRIMNSLEVEKIDETEFLNLCRAKGINPI